jgi:DNA-binding HxlR family transcriptional regulator
MSEIQEKQVAAQKEEKCKKLELPVNDALDVLTGKWKLPIIISIAFAPKRFSQIARDVPGITDRILSRELKEMEMNKLVTRTVREAFPPVVEYYLTDHGRSLRSIYAELAAWGNEHRKIVMGK